MIKTNISNITTQANIAFNIYKKINRKKRYDFLQQIAKNILFIQQEIIETAVSETYLSKDDLTAEFERTIFQIQNYSQFLLSNDFSFTNNGLSLENEPLGAVVVFGASNFPLAYSTIGGDVVSALVAGCSVIFKAHETHIKTSLLVANAIKNAILDMNMPEYVYQHLENMSHSDASLLVQHQAIKAVAFTGSLAVGRYLFDLCQARPEPIPFFGELGSINPVFICHNFFANAYHNIASDYTNSFIKRGGQVCVNPAVLIIPKSTITIDFYRILTNNLQKILPQKMLTDNIFHKFIEAYEYRKENYPSITQDDAVDDNNLISPVLFNISIDEWLSDATLHNEVFGMMGIIIEYETDDDLYKIAETFCGQLTASIHGNNADTQTMIHLETLLAEKVGRLIFNEYPTMITIDDTMQHGGIYPASTCPQFTAIGKRAVYRFLRPVCYQNKPSFLQNFKDKHNFFVTKTLDEQAMCLADFIAKKLSDAVLNNGQAYLGVSGGKSPIAFLNYLSQKYLRWDKITISLVDERCVDTQDPESNEKLIRDNLLINQAKEAIFIGLYNNEFAEESVEHLNNNHNIPKKFDCIVFGMGSDGHFASLFPNSDNLKEGLFNQELKYSIQNASAVPIQRISMNMPFIAHSDVVCLVINDITKLKTLNSVLEDAPECYPIAHLLKKVKINIFYVE